MGNSRLASYVWYFSFLCQIIYVHNCSSAIWLQLKMCCSLIMKALIWSHTWNRSVFNVSLHAFVGPWYKKRAMLCQNLSRNVHFNNNFSKWNENMAERYLVILELKNSVFTMSIEWQCEAFSPFYHTLLGLPWQREMAGKRGIQRWLGLRPASTPVNGKTPFDTSVYGIALLHSKQGVVSEQLEKIPGRNENWAKTW